MPSCIYCNKTFISTRENQKYCSLKCYNENRKKPTQKPCQYCGKPIVGIPSHIKNRKYCSYSCNTRAMHNFVIPEPTKCAYCQKTFIPSKNKGIKFCSFECYYKTRHEKSPIAKPKSCPTCNKEFPTYGTEIYCSRRCKDIARSNKIVYTCTICNKEFFDTPSTKRKYCSRKCKNVNCKRGPDNPLWKGKRIGYRGRNWKEQSDLARIRDDFTCQICGTHQLKPSLTVHHIVPYREFGEDYKSANNLTNLIILCRSCHSKQKIK